MGPGGGWIFRPIGGSYVFEQRPLPLEEVGHLLLTGSLGLVFRNPYFQIGTMFYHWIFHQEEPFSPGGGGPGLPPISTDPPPSLEATGASLTQPGKSGGPASSSKRGSRPRRKCPTGMVWSSTHKKCILDITWGTDQYTRKRR